jgi:hypothetical protein
MQEPVLWFHDLMRRDGTPYREREAEIFRQLAGTPADTPAGQPAAP